MDSEERQGLNRTLRHLCHNRLCINPAHLTTGERGDNRHDDRLQEAYGIDYNWLVG